MTSIFWHRRDFRINDNAGLYKALKNSKSVQSIFIFDNAILSKLQKDDQRVLFIHQEVEHLKKQYQQFGSDLKVYFGNPVLLIPEIAHEFNAKVVYTNRDYEPYALQRDTQIHTLLSDLNIEFIGAKDHVIFEKNEISKLDGLPYTVFTPYSRKWKEKLNPFFTSEYQVEKYVGNLSKTGGKVLITIKELDFESIKKVSFPSREVPIELIQSYTDKRDFPSLDATSHLSLHLRFGTISIRQLVRTALSNNPTFLNELIWRDFYQMIIFHFPHSAKDSFKKQYDRIEWEHNEAHFDSWCNGKTGYPLVDAGMRELNSTGFMHNRVRMVVASFLTKHLLLDWRIGETYFAEKLLDYELASNVGGWQWAAGCGCDAAPYFRVFNPTTQQEKFDKNFEYIKKWVPEFGTSNYPEPIIEHKFARERVLERFKQALNN